MRSRYSTHGTFREFLFFTQEEIDNICTDELAKCGLLPDSPIAIRIDRFIEKRFGKPHTYENLPTGILGLTRFGAKGVQEVVLASSLEDDCTKPGERRLRTTLAHEAGHGLLHAHLFALRQDNPLFGDWTDRRAPQILCRGEVTRSVPGAEPWEYQANMVMGAILMPKRLVRIALEPFMSSTGGLGLRRLGEVERRAAIQNLAELFDVNPVVVRIRLEKMFATKERAQPAL